jgi:hypothetical protein
MNDSDPNLDPVSWQSVDATSAAGGSVQTIGPWLRYVPPPGLTTDDLFNYVISDGAGGMDSGAVMVQVEQNLASTPNVILEDLGNNGTRLRFQVIPGRAYKVQFAEASPGNAWQTLATTNAPANGAIEWVDAPPAGSPPRIYRTSKP